MNGMSEWLEEYTAPLRHRLGVENKRADELQMALTAERQRADAAEKERVEARRELSIWKSSVADCARDCGCSARIEARVVEVLGMEESK